MVDTNNDIKSGPSSLTYEELADRLDRWEEEYKSLVCEAKDKPDCYIGLRHENDPKRIYKVILLDKIVKKRAFRIRWPTWIPLDNSIENIPVSSGRFVLEKYENVTESSFVAENYQRMIPMTSKNYRNVGSTPPSYRPYNMEGKSSPDYDARFSTVLQASLAEEEQREDNPGPPSRNVRFNCPNPTDYMGNMNEDEALAKALALSIRQEGGGGSNEPNTEPPAIPTPSPPTTRDLSELQFDLVIKEISEHPTGSSTDSKTMYQRQLEVVVPDFLRDTDSNVEALDVDLYGVTAETTEEWLERLKRTNVVSANDHRKADIYID